MRIAINGDDSKLLIVEGNNNCVIGLKAQKAY